jgi:hypothetical protein
MAGDPILPSMEPLKPMGGSRLFDISGSHFLKKMAAGMGKAPKPPKSDPVPPGADGDDWIAPRVPALRAGNGAGDQRPLQNNIVLSNHNVSSGQIRASMDPQKTIPISQIAPLLLQAMPLSMFESVSNFRQANITFESNTRANAAFIPGLSGTLPLLMSIELIHPGEDVYLDLAPPPCDEFLSSAMLSCGLAIELRHVNDSLHSATYPVLRSVTGDLCAALKCLADQMATSNCKKTRVKIGSTWINWSIAGGGGGGFNADAACQNAGEIAIATGTSNATAVAYANRQQCSAYASGGTTGGTNAKAVSLPPPQVGGEAAACGGDAGPGSDGQGGMARADGRIAMATGGAGRGGAKGGDAIARGFEDATATGGPGGDNPDGKGGKGGTAWSNTTGTPPSGTSDAKGGTGGSGAQAGDGGDYDAKSEGGGAKAGAGGEPGSGASGQGKGGKQTGEVPPLF